MTSADGGDAASDDPADGPAADTAGRDLPDGVSLPTDLETVRSALLSWYREDHRSFPWRETADPYAILVSEVMSQQTQLSRVEDAWHAFLERWPDAAALAAADRADVVGFWTEHSLGYNNRAKYLHEAARQVTEGEVTAVGDDTALEPGEFPTDPEGLQELQGVGPYTANAVASFAFNDGDAVVDTNVKRVLYRAFDVPDDDAAFEAAASALMPAGESRDWNNAIMELGGVACEQTPSCDEAGCPWRGWCSAYRTGDFTAPDVPTQPPYEGSRRQKRARALEALREHGPQPLDSLGPRVRVDYAPESDGDGSREWLRGLLSDLEDDGLVTIDGETVALQR